ATVPSALNGAGVQITAAPGNLGAQSVADLTVFDAAVFESDFKGGGISAINITAYDALTDTYTFQVLDGGGTPIDLDGTPGADEFTFFGTDPLEYGGVRMTFTEPPAIGDQFV